jgi:hypothetical protein
MKKQTWCRHGSAVRTACGIPVAARLDMFHGSPRFPLYLVGAVLLSGCGSIVPLTSTSPTAPSIVQTTPQNASTVGLTAGTLQLYVGDPGSAHLQGGGFDLTSAAAGNWPQSVAPGTQVNFGGPLTLLDWGNVTLNGATLHGDTAGPGAGRLWITGSLTVNATPLAAPLAPAFSGQLQTSVTMSGTISGFANANGDQPPVFAVSVSGAGTMSGVYRMINAGNTPTFVNNCCVVVQVGAR